MLGIGGGGDVVGALATALLCDELGTPAILGGVSWERLPIDPLPGPRRLEEIVHPVRHLSDTSVLAGPETRTKGGVVFAESRMADHLGQDTVLVAIDRGPQAIAAGLEQAAAELGVDLLFFVDVGGDVLGDGSEPGLASPLCDAVMLAAAAHLQQHDLQVVAGVFGPCCDGELTVEELLDRLAKIAGCGALLDVKGMDKAVTSRLEAAARAIPTEASAQAVRCARGELGTALIRGGRRAVPLSPLGATTFYFDPSVAVQDAAPLARSVSVAMSLEQANDILHELGVRTELDYEHLNAER